MKKILFCVLLLLTAFIAYPLKTDKTTVPATAIEASDLEGLYNEYTNSTNYAFYNAKQKAFVEKMNFDGTESDLESNAAVLKWIDNNLAKTKFADYAQAVSEFNSLNSDFHTLKREHNGFYKAVVLATEKDFAEVVYNRNGIALTSENNSCSCTGAYNTSLKGAAKKYSRDVKEPGVSVAIELKFYMHNEMCKIAREYCLEGCEQ